MTRPKPIKVCILEDNRRVRESLAVLVDGTPGLRCIGTHASAEGALRDVPQQKPDVVVAGIALEGKAGAEWLRRLKSLLPSLKIIVHLAFKDREHVFDALHAGASGYLLPDTPPARLLEAIVEAYQGGAPMTPQIAGMVVEHFHRLRPAQTQQASLSAREREILEAAAKGCHNKEIADELGIRIDTVRSHLRSIHEKLGVSSRTAAVAKYLTA